MNLAGLIPADLTTVAAIAVCAIAFVSGTARGFSGFGSALIFMPLASSMAAPRLFAALLPFTVFICVAPCRPQGGRHHRCRRADRRADRHLFPEPSRSRDDALDHLRFRGRLAGA